MSLPLPYDPVRDPSNGTTPNPPPTSQLQFPAANVNHYEEAKRLWRDTLVCPEPPQTWEDCEKRHVEWMPCRLVPVPLCQTRRYYVPLPHQIDNIVDLHGIERPPTQERMVYGYSQRPETGQICYSRFPLPRFNGPSYTGMMFRDPGVRAAFKGEKTLHQLPFYQDSVVKGSMTIIFMWPGYMPYEFIVNTHPDKREQELWRDIWLRVKEWSTRDSGAALPTHHLWSLYEAQDASPGVCITTDIHIEGLYRLPNDPNNLDYSDKYVLQTSVLLPPWKNAQPVPFKFSMV